MSLPLPARAQRTLHVTWCKKRKRAGELAAQLAALSGGGRIVASGTPEDVAEVPESHTGRYLGPMLQAARRRAAAE